VTIPAPVIVFEVLSPGPENRQRDEEEKVDEYESVPSILRYVVVESETRGVRVFWREPGERLWRRDPLDPDGPLQLPEFGVTVTFDEIYEGVDLD
jgi:Uma2 family endonuclease